VIAVEAETIGLPFAKAVVSVMRTYEQKRRGQQENGGGVRYFVTSLDPLDYTPAQFAEIIRSHWSIENKNHWKRDAQWREDKPRFRNSKTAQVFAVLRGAVLALCNEPCPAIFTRCRHRPASAIALINAPLQPLN
jgi:predicted transposase YbfD/YdcC